MKIKEIKEETLKMMEAKYKNINVFTPVSDLEIETNYFLRKNHAEALRKCAKNNGFIVSFRKAGKHTLKRIEQGNPCKGHDILNKSIKEKGAAYTYDIDPETFEKLNGLIGYSEENSSSLKGLWKCINNKPNQVQISEVNNTNNLNEFFTGDYDMHDLIKNNSRILAATIDEKSAIDQLNNALLRNDEIRKEKVKKSINENQRIYSSSYALIRHGAQTSFISYLLSDEGKGDLKITDTARLPLEGTVTTIDPDIVIFLPNGEAYILKTISEVYNFYKKFNLLSQVPFYNFFDDLKKVDTYKPKLDSYTKYINELLKKSLHK